MIPTEMENPRWFVDLLQAGQFDSYINFKDHVEEVLNSENLRSIKSLTMLLSTFQDDFPEPLHFDLQKVILSAETLTYNDRRNILKSTIFGEFRLSAALDLVLQSKTPEFAFEFLIFNAAEEGLRRYRADLNLDFVSAAHILDTVTTLEMTWLSPAALEIADDAAKVLVEAGTMKDFVFSIKYYQDQIHNAAGRGTAELNRSVKNFEKSVIAGELTAKYITDEDILELFDNASPATRNFYLLGAMIQEPDRIANLLTKNATFQSQFYDSFFEFFCNCQYHHVQCTSLIIGLSKILEERHIIPKTDTIFGLVHARKFKNDNTPIYRILYPERDEEYECEEETSYLQEIGIPEKFTKIRTTFANQVNLQDIILAEKAQMTGVSLTEARLAFQPDYRKESRAKLENSIPQVGVQPLHFTKLRF